MRVGLVVELGRRSMDRVKYGELYLQSLGMCQVHGNGVRCACVLSGLGVGTVWLYWAYDGNFTSG